MGFFSSKSALLLKCQHIYILKFPIKDNGSVRLEILKN